MCLKELEQQTDDGIERLGLVSVAREVRLFAVEFHGGNSAGGGAGASIALQCGRYLDGGWREPTARGLVSHGEAVQYEHAIGPAVLPRNVNFLPRQQVRAGPGQTRRAIKRPSEELRVFVDRSAVLDEAVRQLASQRCQPLLLAVGVN